MKTCNKCGEEKPFTEFSKRKDTRDGLNYKCKACDSAYQAQRYLQNPDAIKANAKKWAEANPERKRANGAEWRVANADKLKADHAAWYAANAQYARQRMADWHKANVERRKQTSAQWREANPGRSLALSRKKKAAKIQRTPPWADNDKIAAIYEEAAALRQAGEDVHVDHIVPLQGALVSGLHVHNNLRIVPASENLKKRNKFDVSMTA